MVTWKEVHMQDEMRKVRMAQAEQARMVKAAKAENNATSKNKPYLFLLGAATRLVKATGSLKVQETQMPLTSES